MLPNNRYDDRRLREDALRAFARALHTDRMVAITGAMATQALGYPEWSEFVAAYALIAWRLATEISERRQVKGEDRTSSAPLLNEVKVRAARLLIDNLPPQAVACAPRLPGTGPKPHAAFISDVRVLMWVIYDMFKRIDAEMHGNRAGLVIDATYQDPALDRFERRVAAIFATRTPLVPAPTNPEDRAATVRPLIASLGIKRVATLNYDMELERAFMLRHDEHKLLKHYETQLQTQDAYKKAIAKGVKDAKEILKAKPPEVPHRDISRVKNIAAFAAKYEIEPNQKLASITCFIGPSGSGRPIVMGERSRLTRTMGNGVAVESDVVNRERPDRLLEFAVGSAEIDRHIMHLHGRANAPKTMVANIRQYDRLYRLDDLYRDPFDHGLRMLIGGNPVLFLGIGMKERELNDILQYFVSNAPIRRPAPMFVIWNTPAELKGDAASTFRANMRLDLQIRLGVHVLFDDDIGSPPGLEPLQALPRTLAKLPDLVNQVDRQAEVGEGPWRSIERRLGTSEGGEPHRMWGSVLLRSLAHRWRETDARGKPKEQRRFNLHLLKATMPLRNVAQAEALIFAESLNGYGRGELSEYLIDVEDVCDVHIGDAILKGTQRCNRLLINAGFSYDSDTLMSGIARFLIRLIPEPNDAVACRSRYIEDGRLINPPDPTQIIINGADRFFGVDGTPLSAEFDLFLRCVNRPGHNLQVLLLGTLRMRPYCEMLGVKLHTLPDAARIPEQNSPTIDGGSATPPLNSIYLEWVRSRFDTYGKRPTDQPVRREDRFISVAARAALEQAILVDREAQNKAFFEAYLSPTILSALGLNCPAIFEILRTLSFVGAPMEAAMLMHAPKVRAILAECHDVRDKNGRATKPQTDAFNRVKIKRNLVETVKALAFLDLMVKLDPHQPDSPALKSIAETADEPERRDDDFLWGRYGLHRSLATFLRNRHGAPINDAKLATTFNISLFMSEPTDANTPEPSFHLELGTLVDNLIGAWHDLTPSDFPIPFERLNLGSGVDNLKKASIALYDYYIRSYGKSDHDDLQCLYLHSTERLRAIENLLARASRISAACLRAAFSILRGYYSTGALLKFESETSEVEAGRDGALTEHAQRIDRLITGYHDIAAARRIAGDLLMANHARVPESDPHIGARPPNYIEHCLGPEPLYADDLVWLYNERATVALVQGNLFAAREAISRAERVNEKQVEKSHFGHNWRRIQINKIGLRIERGSLKPAERLLDLVEHTVKNPPWLPERIRPADRIEQIRALFTEAAMSAPARGTQDVTREEMLVVGMLTGYRGLIAHLRGRYHEAKSFYQIATRMLRQLGEQRAYAHFQRQQARLESFFGNKQTALREIEYAIAAAQAARQMDILHRSRIVRADLIRQTSQDQAKRRNALEDIKDALRYSAQSDCYRVRIEASASLARHMRVGGDYDTALRYAADAMTIAARYGHSLQKTILRIELGKILEARGDPKSGKALIDQAVAIGTSKGYSQALERARRALNPPAAANWIHLTVSDESEAGV